MILYTPTPEHFYEDYIAHHGIKGQKWGVKNGPPYPLNSEGKASFKRNNLGKGDIQQKRKVNGKLVDSYKKAHNEKIMNRFEEDQARRAEINKSTDAIEKWFKETYLEDHADGYIDSDDPENSREDIIDYDMIRQARRALKDHPELKQDISNKDIKAALNSQWDEHYHKDPDWKVKQEIEEVKDYINPFKNEVKIAAEKGVQEHKQRLKKAIDSEGDMLKDLFNAYEQNGDIESETAYRKALKRVAKENGITRWSLENELIKNIEPTSDNISNNKPSHGIKGQKWGVRKIDQEQQKKTQLSSEDLKNIENAILNAPKIKHKPGEEYDNTKFNDHINSQMEKILDKKSTVNKDKTRIKEIANKANAVKNDIRLDENDRKYKKLKKELEKFIEINESDQSKFDEIYKNATDAHKKYYEYMEKQPTKGVSEALKNKKFNSIYDTKLLTEQRRIDYANELTNKFLKDNGIESNGKDNIHRLTYNIILDSLNVNSYDRLVKNRG